MEPIPLGQKELKELLNKGWMTHDAMWFYNCLQECGIEKTNKINRAAVKGMAAVEMKRMKKALGVVEITNFDDLARFFETCMAIVSGDFMKYRFTYPGGNVIRSEWISCFAYEGIKALGVIDRYECGIMDRIEGWWDALALKWEVQPKVTGCMMHTDGVCYREYKFFFEK
jgi:Family of unknown function (DUF6125)